MNHALRTGPTRMLDPTHRVFAGRGPIHLFVLVDIIRIEEQHRRISLAVGALSRIDR